MTQPATFVFTDLVGSVALKQRMPGADSAQRDEAYVRLVLGPHRERIESGLADAGGRVVSTAGDGHFLVFADPVRAARWAIDVVHSHQDQPITATPDDAARAEVRIGIHTGVPQVDPADPDNFIGRAVDYAARLADHAEGGQILASKTAASLIEDGGLAQVRLHRHASRELRGIGEVEVHQVLHADWRPRDPRRSPRSQGQPRVVGPAADDEPHRVHGAQRRFVEFQRDDRLVETARTRRIGNYELGELLGAGGMGAVYKARHSQFDRPRER